MRILVIEDEKNAADLLVMVLQSRGHEAMAIYGGAEAAEIAQQFQADCVICDVIMPVIGGIEACTAIEAQLPRCHIFLFSGKPMAGELMDEARARGKTWELWAKPMPPDDLLAKLNALKGR